MVKIFFIPILIAIQGMTFLSQSTCFSFSIPSLFSQMGHSSATRSPVMAMYIQAPVSATVDGTKPAAWVTLGSARMPAPTVVPATKTMAFLTVHLGLQKEGVSTAGTWRLNGRKSTYFERPLQLICGETWPNINSSSGNTEGSLYSTFLRTGRFQFPNIKISGIYRNLLVEFHRMAPMAGHPKNFNMAIFMKNGHRPGLILEDFRKF